MLKQSIKCSIFLFLFLLLFLIANETHAQYKKNNIETTFFIVDKYGIFAPFEPEIGYGRRLTPYLLLGAYWKPDFYNEPSQKNLSLTARIDVSIPNLLFNNNEQLLKWDIFPSLSYDYVRSKIYDGYSNIPEEEKVWYSTHKIVFGAGLSRNLGDHWVLLTRYKFDWRHELYFGVRFQF
jgi:hypothetical protein